MENVAIHRLWETLMDDRTTDAFVHRILYIVAILLKIKIKIYKFPMNQESNDRFYSLIARSIFIYTS